MRRSISLLGLASLLLTIGHGVSDAQTGEKEHRRADQVMPGESTLSLSLPRAVEIALAPAGNVRVQLVQEMIHQAEARSVQSLAALLPAVESSVTEQNQTRNLAAFGIRFETPVPGFRIPERVGPFKVFDARATLSQNIFDISSIRRFQASRVVVEAAATEAENTRDEVAGQVAKAYVSALRTEANLEAIQANVALAEKLLKLARDQKEAGTGTGIEITRAEVQLVNERQRLLVAENERHQAHLQLLKIMGLNLDIILQLADKLTRQPVEALSVERAVTVGLQSRADFKAQQQRENSARLTHSAIKLERVPSIVGFADYGPIGSSINHAVPTRTYGVSMRVPVFDGGRRDARRAESASQLEQERIRTKDLRQEIELEIRLALDGLSSAEEQVKVATEGLELAERELAQAERRYQAGVTTSVEITDAQARLERARDNQVAALFNHNVARINLGESMGTIRRMIK